MKITVRNINFVFVFIALVFGLHSVIPHHHHYNFSQDIIPHATEHCISLNDVVAENFSISTSYKTQKYFSPSFLSEITDFVVNTKKDYFILSLIDKKNHTDLSFFIKNIPTRGSPA